MMWLSAALGPRRACWSGLPVGVSSASELRLPVGVEREMEPLEPEGAGIPSRLAKLRSWPFLFLKKKAMVVGLIARTARRKLARWGEKAKGKQRGGDSRCLMSGKAEMDYDCQMQMRQWKLAVEQDRTRQDRIG